MIAVSNVSMITPSPTAGSRQYGMRMKASRQAPAAPVRCSTESSDDIDRATACGVVAPTVTAHELQRPGHPGLQRMVVGFEGQHEHGRASVADAGEHGFRRIEQPAIARIESRLRECPHAGDGGEVIVELRGGRRAESRRHLHAHPGFGDHAERALGADDQPVRCRPRTGAGQPPRLHHAGRRHQPRGLHEVVDVRVQRGVMAARARRDPPAERSRTRSSAGSGAA